ncbi:MAG: metalloregulator ArsR/SmtB family transcription factor [Elusimicrobia bacterium]|nr:metalloregulator ArsR/SmtB family transcription factor [Elusimicrobiota bacterium]
METYLNIFKSLSDGTRIRILRILLEAGIELCVCEIMDSLRVKQYNISSHIKELRLAGLVKERKDGRFVFYCLNKQKERFVKNIFSAVMSIPEVPFKSDIERLRKRLSLRVGCKVVVTKDGRKKP